MSLESAKAAFVSASNALVQINEDFKVNLAAAMAALGQSETTLNLDLSNSSAKAGFVSASNALVQVISDYKISLTAAVAALGESETALHALGGT